MQKFGLAIVKLIVCTGVPPDALDSRWFWDMMQKFTEPGYTPLSSTRFWEYLLSAKVKDAEMQVMEIIQSSTYLTVSYYKCSSCGKKCVCTTTVSLPDDRSFTMDRHEHTCESHTGEAVAKTLLNSISHVRLNQYSAVCRDNISNIRVYRQIIYAQNPKILNSHDALHLINNTMPDISILS